MLYTPGKHPDGGAVERGPGQGCAPPYGSTGVLRPSCPGPDPGMQPTIEGRASSTAQKATAARDRARDEGGGRMWYAGIDWADQHHDAVIIDDAGKRVAAIRVEHTVAGLAKLTGFLRGLGDVADHPEL